MDFFRENQPLWGRERRSVQRLLHFPNVGADLGRGVLAVFLQNFDDGGADDGAIGNGGHFFGLLRRGDAESDRAGKRGILPDGFDDPCKIRCDFAAHPGDAEAGNKINKAFGFPGDHADPIPGGGRDQGDQIDAVLAAERKKFNA